MKIVYVEKYKRGSVKIGNYALPDLNHLSEGFYCYEAEVKQAGLMENKGTRFHFQDIRVILKERGKTINTEER